MATLTTKLGLSKPDTTDQVLVSVLNANMDSLDSVAGQVYVCTSSTRPSGSNLWDGRVIFETDTGELRVYVSGTTTWELVGIKDLGETAYRGVDNYYARQTTPITGIGTSHVAVFTATNFVWKAGRAYRVSLETNFSPTSGSPTEVEIRIQNAAMTVTYKNWGWHTIHSSLLRSQTGFMYLGRNSSTDLTQTILASAKCNTGVVQMYANTTGNSCEFAIEDVGPVSNYTGIYTL
jgi:hypothetical protein